MSGAAALVGDLKEIVREQYDFRELLYQMTRRDLLLRYKQAIMGFGWTSRYLMGGTPIAVPHPARCQPPWRGVRRGLREGGPEDRPGNHRATIGRRPGDRQRSIGQPTAACGGAALLASGRSRV
jgi:hypothetical protein